MKNSKEYAKKISKLYRSLKQKYPKAKKVTFEDSLDAVVYGVPITEIAERLFSDVPNDYPDCYGLVPAEPDELDRSGD